MRQPRTLCELFQYSLADRPRERAYLHKAQGTYRPVSSRAFADRVEAIAAALRQIGVQPGDRVAILAPNRLEWAIADYATLHCGAVTVPIYPTLQAGAVQHILNDCGAMAAFVADAEQLQKLGNPKELPHLQYAILLDPPAPEAEGPRHILPLGEFETRGAAAHDPEAFTRTWGAVTPDTLATLIYTSGTTGVPKGVMLTHANIVSNVLTVLHRLPIGPTDSCLSFLPLSHIFERMAGHFTMWHAGTCIAFAENVEAVPQNLLEVRPTILVSVPRLYEKMNARVLAAIAEAPPLRQKLFAWATDVGRRKVQAEQAERSVSPWLHLQYAIADRLVFAKLRERLGGRIRFMVSGGAPLAPAIAEFFHAAGLFILEGYGLTETSPVIAVNPIDRPRIGTVGPAVDGIELRLAEDGEIIVRGPNVMQGYFGLQQETEAALRDGWFHTGDVGQVDANGYLRITDRIKDLIVTAGGKNVAPQPIESRLKSSRFIAEVVLIGDQRKYVSALLVPQFANLEAQARTLGVEHKSAQELVRAPEIVQLYEKLIGALNTRLAPYERIKRFCLLERELQLETGEITPTMKVKRNVVARTHADLIESLYARTPRQGVGCPPTDAGEPEGELAGDSASRS
jgi:long-chain acyl-CoA synthetase